jgi:lipid-A-disaccharide synthase
MDKEVVKELIQGDLNTHQLKKELEKILTSPKREEILNNYEILQQKLGGQGASKKTASLLLKRIKKQL